MLVDMRKQIIITCKSKVEGWVGVCRGVSQCRPYGSSVVLQYVCTKLQLLV